MTVFWFQVPCIRKTTTAGMYEISVKVINNTAIPLKHLSLLLEPGVCVCVDSSISVRLFISSEIQVKLPLWHSFSPIARIPSHLLRSGLIYQLLEQFQRVLPSVWLHPYIIFLAKSYDLIHSVLSILLYLWNLLERVNQFQRLPTPPSYFFPRLTKNRSYSLFVNQR